MPKNKLWFFWKLCFLQTICLQIIYIYAESLLHSLERAAGDVGLQVNTDKTEYMCFNPSGDISTLNGGPLKLVDKFT